MNNIKLNATFPYWYQIDYNIWVQYILLQIDYNLFLWIHLNGLVVEPQLVGKVSEDIGGKLCP
jgi:hypothetical protein